MATPIVRSFAKIARGAGATPQNPIPLDGGSAVIPAGYTNLNAVATMDQVDIDALDINGDPLNRLLFRIMYDPGTGPQVWSEFPWVGGPNMGKGGGISPPPGCNMGLAGLAGTGHAAWPELVLPQPLSIGGSMTLT